MRGNRVHVASIGGPFDGVRAATVKRRAEKMLDALGLARAELSIALVDDATIRGLNRAYRRKDKATDVLSFALVEIDKKKFQKACGMLGDVVLAVETCRRQAKENARPLMGELTMLLAHGILHILGFDHATAKEEREMTAKTKELEAAAAARASKA